MASSRIFEDIGFGCRCSNREEGVAATYISASSNRNRPIKESNKPGILSVLCWCYFLLVSTFEERTCLNLRSEPADSPRGGCWGEEGGSFSEDGAIKEPGCVETQVNCVMIR